MYTDAVVYRLHRDIGLKTCFVEWRKDMVKIKERLVDFFAVVIHKIIFLYLSDAEECTAPSENTSPDLFSVDGWGEG